MIGNLRRMKSGYSVTDRHRPSTELQQIGPIRAGDDGVGL